MIGQTLQPEQMDKMPDYHEGMLILKVRSFPQRVASMVEPKGMVAAAVSSPEVTRALSGSPGLSTLSTLERAGLIKEVIPLSPSVKQRTPHLGVMSAMSTLAASVDLPSEEEDLNSGVSLVQVENDEDVRGLQKTLANDRNVEFVSRVPMRYLTLDSPSTGSQAVPSPDFTMWNLRKIQWEAARALPNFQEADDIQVAVLDTGVDSDHPDLAGQVSSYVFDYPDYPGISSEQDIVGHGTHVAGIIAADNSSNLGVKGLCRCGLKVWKIFNDHPEVFPGAYRYVVDPAMYRQALAACARDDVDVINMSFGSTAPPEPQESVLYDALLDKGTTIVAAMGNYRMWESPTCYPAAIPGFIAVGATSLDDNVALFSSGGSHISLCAPGVAIWSTMPTYSGQTAFEAVQSNGGWRRGSPHPRETGYGALPGTSMASPHIAAAVALLLATEGRMGPADVHNRFKATADKVDAMGGADFHIDYGAGRLNLERLLSPQSVGVRQSIT